jgi:hypothetical protein
MTESKPCLVCNTPLPMIGPCVCSDHGGTAQLKNHFKYVTLKEPRTEVEIGCYFKTVEDEDLGVPATYMSTVRTNFTECWCSIHWHAYEATSPWCPICRMAEMRDEAIIERATVFETDAQHPDALTASQFELERRGWTRSPEEHAEAMRPKGRKRMAKKAKNGEQAAGTNGNGDPTKVINCTKTLRVKLTDAEIRERAELAASTKAERDAIDEELKSHAAEVRGKIKGLDQELRTLLLQVGNGHESRPIQCRKEFLYRTNTMRIVRVDDGDVVEERDMLPEEIEQHKQMPIQAKGANEETVEGDPDEKPKRGRKKKQAAEQTASPAE